MIPQHQSWWNARIGELVRNNPDWHHLYYTDPSFHAAVDQLAVFCHLANTAARTVTGRDLLAGHVPLKPWLETILTRLYDGHSRAIILRELAAACGTINTETGPPTH